MTCGFRRKVLERCILHFKVIPAETDGSIGQKSRKSVEKVSKTLILPIFSHFKAFFAKNLENQTFPGHTVFAKC